MSAKLELSSTLKNLKVRILPYFSPSPWLSISWVFCFRGGGGGAVYAARGGCAEGLLINFSAVVSCVRILGLLRLHR
jgi:hypothetical protein